MLTSGVRRHRRAEQMHPGEILTNLIWFHQSRLIAWSDKVVLRKRAIIKSVTDVIKNISQIEHTRHRSPTNVLLNLVAGLNTYCHQPKEPSLGLDPLALLLPEIARTPLTHSSPPLQLGRNLFMT